MRFNTKQREVLAEKLADLGNIAIGSLVCGYVVRSEVFNILSLLRGLAIAGAAYGYAIALEPISNLFGIDKKIGDRLLEK